MDTIVFFPITTNGTYTDAKFPSSCCLIGQNDFEGDCTVYNLIEKSI